MGGSVGHVLALEGVAGLVCDEVVVYIACRGEIKAMSVMGIYAMREGMCWAKPAKAGFKARAKIVWLDSVLYGASQTSTTDPCVYS